MESVTPALAIGAAWERTSDGDPEERATFAMLSIRCGDIVLTEGHDTFVDRLRDGPLVSAYHAAEWLAWNWWRLRWEPKTSREDWLFAHDMTTIGHGYVWPNVTIRSDGHRVAFTARPSRRPDAKPFRYIVDRTLIVGAGAFEGAIDGLIPAVIERLRLGGIGETNLDRIWRGVTAERADPALSLQRRIEALRGDDPDDADDAVIAARLADAPEAGIEAVAELAAHEGAGGRHHSLADLRTWAHRAGFETDPRDAVALAGGGIAAASWHPAWVVGGEAARALRRQEGLGAAPVSTARLEALAGIIRGAVVADAGGGELSFALNDTASRIVLRSRWETGRRFDLARLIGDRLAIHIGERLRPATRTYTWRQQLQRAFAGEFLCPFEAAADMLHGDYSDESIEEVARHFDVSTWTVSTHLMNHGRISRDEIGRDVGTDAAA